MLRSMQRIAVAMVAIAALICGMPHGARADTTTRPAAAATGMRPGPASIIQRYKRAVAQLDLTGDEQSKVDGVFDKANQRGLDLSQTLAGAQPDDRYQLLRGFAKQIRQDLAGVLTDDQMSNLDQKIGPGFGQRNGGQRNAAAQSATQPNDALPPTDQATSNQRPGGRQNGSSP